MAKSSGILKIEGTLENLTFYKSADGHMVRTKGGVSRNRILNDPAFVRTRENGVEFGHSAQAGKLLRMAAGQLVFKAKDSKLSSRMLKVMSGIKNADTSSLRGERNVFEGIQSEAGKQFLRGFDFNQRAILPAVLYAPYAVDTVTGAITIADFNPLQQLRNPQGATHFSMQSAFLNLDFSTAEYDITYSNEVNLPTDSGTATQTLTPSGVPAGSGIQFYFLLIEFFQEVNSVQYPLNNGAFNVLNIVAVQ